MNLPGGGVRFGVRPRRSFAMPGFDAAARARLTDALKAEARRLGFDGCGVSEATELSDDARHLERWLAQGRHASMAWMENHFDKRIDPRRLVEGARSVVSVLHSYYQPAPVPSPDPSIGRIARYAWGDDYHDVLRARLGELFAWLDGAVGGSLGGRVFTDSAPVLDKAWAARSGLGWVGKNSLLLSPRLGSFFFVGEMIVDVPLAYDGPMTDHCGSCTRCLDACPTGAIVAPMEVDANRCISYLTIEHRGPQADDAPVGDVGNWIFGCDVCQDVCPWTQKFSQPTREPRYAAREGVADTPLAEWAELDVETFRARFKGSAVKRTKHEGLLRNIEAARRSTGR